MIPCVIESPFRGANKAEEARNVAYLEKLIRHCVLNGYTPYASHKMITGALNDGDPEERRAGIIVGFAMADFVLDSHPDSVVFFGVDYGDSDGMRDFALPHHRAKNRTIVELEVGKL